MKQPNLFAFATSELSQDAFLCWLTALAGAEEATLRDLGQRFIGWLWSTASGRPCDPAAIRLLRGPVRQEHKIDVVFEAEIDGAHTVFATLFHRIDKRKDAEGAERYYLSTRQYARVKGNTEAREAKLLRLAEYRRVFVEARHEAGSGLLFDAPAADHQGANESEIGILFFDSISNTTSAVVEQFPRVHEAFVARLRQSQL